MASLSGLRVGMFHVTGMAIIARGTFYKMIIPSLLIIEIVLGIRSPVTSNPSISNDLFPSLDQKEPEVLVVNPTVKVRLANPQFNCTTYEYCLDVEFQSDQPNYELFGMNVRFFMDDKILEFIDFRGFLGGYSVVAPTPPVITTSTAGIPWFNFSGEADFINGAIQLTNTNTTPIVISTSGWTKVFQACFRVDSPNGSETNFCPPIVWDLKAIPSQGGYSGSAGVVMTVWDGTSSSNAIENVVQYNWEYIGSGSPPYGQPIPITCSSIDCGSCPLTVTNTQDSGAGSLRAAILCSYSGDTIGFASSLAGQTINITSTKFQLSKNLNFHSTYTNHIKIYSQIAGLFDILPYTTLEFKELDITSGLSVTDNLGAAFRNEGILKLINSKVFKNPSLPTGQYLIRNRPGSQFSLTGSCFIEIP